MISIFPPAIVIELRNTSTVILGPLVITDGHIQHKLAHVSMWWLILGISAIIGYLFGNTYFGLSIGCLLHYVLYYASDLYYLFVEVAGYTVQLKVNKGARAVNFATIILSKRSSLRRVITVEDLLAIWREAKII